MYKTDEGATMPKTFPILIDVEEIAVGRVMRVLNKMPGVAKLHLDLVEKKEAKANGSTRPPHKKFPNKAEADIVEALFVRGQLNTAQLKEIFIAKGRQPQSVGSAITGAKNAGDLKKADSGEGWVLTKVARDRLRAKARYGNGKKKSKKSKG